MMPLKRDRQMSEALEIEELIEGRRLQMKEVFQETSPAVPK